MPPDPFPTEVFDDLVEALARLDSISVLYPVTHTRCRETAACAIGAITWLSDKSGLLSLELAGERWMLGSKLIPLSTPAIVALLADFDRLGFTRLEIEPEVTVEHLYQLVSRMRAARQRIQTASELEARGLGLLPPTIRVHQREFNQRAFAAAIALGEGVPLDNVVERAGSPLQAVGVDEKTREAGRKWVENSIRQIAERVETETATAAAEVAPEGAQRSLDDVLRVAGQTMEHTLAGFLTHSSDHDELKHMFKSIEMATEVCDDPVAARLMADVLNESARELLGGSEGPPKRTDDAGSGQECRSTLDELCRQLVLLKPAIVQMANLEQDGRSEAFAIALGSLIRPVSDAALTRIVAKLPTLLTPPWTPLEDQTLVDALRALFANGTEHMLDRALPEISACLGNERAELWLAAAVDCAQTGTPERFAILWPHLVNEVLLGPRSDSQVALSRALAQTARLPQANLSAGIARLLGMTAFKHGSISPYAIAWEKDELLPLYAELLESQHWQAIGELLLASLKSEPPPWKFGIVFHTFSSCDDSCRDLLRDLLQHGTLNQAQPSTRLKAGRLIAECILTLPLGRAGETWVPLALEALGSLRSGEATPALRRILSERKNMILPLWPAECREAARHALAQLERAGIEPKD